MGADMHRFGTPKSSRRRRITAVVVSLLLGPAGPEATVPAAADAGAGLPAAVPTGAAVTDAHGADDVVRAQPGRRRRADPHRLSRTQRWR
jgi:hypothetical protein